METLGFHGLIQHTSKDSFLEETQKSWIHFYFESVKRRENDKYYLGENFGRTAVHMNEHLGNVE